VAKAGMENRLMQAAHSEIRILIFMKMSLSSLIDLLLWLIESFN
jgi:hypothetical protein